ncbi:hypothetical protein DPMN_054201 [Dreissena polymorpha]|uniref:Uncharacterized protein n=1 Tax=Dreissena polymorpha TaxID=45954 RepID=A0A9D4HSV6_DREPO|nr:hypothetical protein DPMN_054201 [Dreissena polymorpha]
MICITTQDVIRRNLLTNFHDEVLTSINSPFPGGHVFHQTRTIFVHIQDMIKTNILTKCHEDWTINVTLSMKTSFYYSHLRKNAPPPSGNVFQPTGTIFEHIQDIIGTNLLNKFHEHQIINVASKVLTWKNARPPGGNFHEDWTIMWPLEKNAPPPGSHVFQATGTIFELVQDIIGTNLLTNVYKRPYIIGTNLLTKIHEDPTINVASRVLTRKNAPNPRSHVFQRTETNFTLIQDFIGTNLLTKFHEDWTINVASSVLTRQMLLPHAARQTKGDHKSSP